jgi:hypothetical protein
VARAHAEMEDRLATANGVPVLEVVRMKSSGGDPQAAQARSTPEQLAKKSGPEGEMPNRLSRVLRPLVRLPRVFEITLESSNFSTAAT